MFPVRYLFQTKIPGGVTARPRLPGEKGYLFGPTMSQQGCETLSPWAASRQPGRNLLLFLQQSPRRHRTQSQVSRERVQGRFLSVSFQYTAQPSLPATRRCPWGGGQSFASGGTTDICCFL